MGISGSLLRWFSDYLCDRKQFVVVEGSNSSYLDVTSGVPQGSVSDRSITVHLPDTTYHSKVPLFADDNKCYRAIKSQSDSGLLQKDLNSMIEWSFFGILNLMFPNPFSSGCFVDILHLIMFRS